MLATLATFVRRLSGRDYAALRGHLLSQIETAKDGTQLILLMAGGTIEKEQALAQMTHIVIKAESHRQSFNQDLRYSLAPPIDREDLYRFSRSIEEVTENVSDLAQEIHIFAVADEPLLATLMEGVADGLSVLATAVDQLTESPDQARSTALDARNHDVRRTFQLAMAHLLSRDPVTSATLRRRELLRRADIVGLRLSEAADALADGIIKRVH